MTIPVAHDFICPWCWVGLLQARRLQSEFAATIEWLPYELFPEAVPYPFAAPPAEAPPRNRPPTLSRFEFLLAADGVEMPRVRRPRGVKTTKAHLLAVASRSQGREDAVVEAIYRAYWEGGEDISDDGVLRRIADQTLSDPDAAMACVRRRCGMDEITPYDEPAYQSGVYNVPTFFIGGRRYAEQPYSVLLAAAERARRAEDAGEIYSDLNLGPAPSDRPYVVMDMVSTLDGKTVSGEADEDVADLGSPVDHALMKRIEAACDGVMLGAGTLRATTRAWIPVPETRVVVTRNGDLPADAGFFHGGRAYAAISGSRHLSPPTGVKLLRAGDAELDFAALLRRLRGIGVERLLVLGGSELNAALLREGLVDEVFLTLAPKMKLGRCLPTYAGGDPLPRGGLLHFDLTEHHVVGDEVFLRYRSRPGG